MNASRLTALLVTGVLALGACTGGGDEADESQLPLPKKAPSLAGPANGPALVPKVLLASSDELDESLGATDTAQVERRSGAFITGQRVVGYSVDNISGYDLKTGEQQWTSKLDLGGGTVCYVSQPDRAVKTFTVAYGESGFCDQVATLKVSDGSVAKQVDMSELSFNSTGPGGGPVEALFTVKGVDYIVDFDGVVHRMKGGEPQKITQLEQKTYFNLGVSPEAPLLVGTEKTDDGTCVVDAYELPSFDLAWSKTDDDVFPGVSEDCVLSEAKGNPLWISEETTDRNYLAQLSPKDGSVLGTTDVPKNDRKIEPGVFDPGYASLQQDQSLGLPNGDVIFPQVGGIIRHNLKTKKTSWFLRLDQVQLASNQEYPSTVSAPLAVTDDGRHVITVLSNETTVEVFAVETKTGKVAARWPLPEEYRNGFQVAPNVQLFDDGLVMTRNFEAWEFAFSETSDVKPPSGERYDIGVFTFPEADDEPSKVVPTEGPTDLEMSAAGGLPTDDLPKPTSPDGGHSVDLIDNRKQVLALDGNQLSGFSPSGKKQWTTDIADGDISLCSVSEPDQQVGTVLVAYRPEGDEGQGGCPNVARVGVKTGKLEQVQVPASTKGVNRITTADGTAYLITNDGAVHRVEDGKLVRHAALTRVPYYDVRTPEDPSLLVTSTMIKPGQWAIEGYDLPSFKRRWATTGAKVFGAKIGESQYLEPWNGNGLWLSTGFGGSATKSPTSVEVVRLDPATGKVTSRSGKVKNDLLAEDLKKFFPGQAYLNASTTVGFDDGDVVLQQDTGVQRYSLAEKKIVWATDIDSIMKSMESKRSGAPVDRAMRLIDGGKKVLVTLSNGTSAELMHLDADSGKITGRWKVPTSSVNGLQAGPEVVPLSGGVALGHDASGWQYLQADLSGARAGKGFDVGIFRYPKD